VLGRIEKIYEMVWNSGAQVRRGLCCANIELSIDGAGVGRDDLAIKMLRDSHGQLGLARGRRPQDQERLLTLH
jgi:hypothetical protein